MKIKIKACSDMTTALSPVLRIKLTKTRREFNDLDNDTTINFEKNRKSYGEIDVWSKTSAWKEY